jgi:hypothetical protein
MDEQLVATLTRGNWTAEIYSLSMPGEFEVVYRNNLGQEIDRARLTGISTYREREAEIAKRLEQLRTGDRTAEKPDLEDAGEY